MGAVMAVYACCPARQKDGGRGSAAVNSSVKADEKIAAIAGSYSISGGILLF